MVEFTLPKNSRVGDGQDLAEARGGAVGPDRIPDLPLGSGHRRQSAHRHLLRRPRRLRADGPRRPDLDEEQGRSDADLPPLVPRGRVRLVRDEHRRREHARLHQGDGRHRRRDRGPAAAPPAGDQGPGPGPHRRSTRSSARSSRGSRRRRRSRRRNGGRATTTAPSSTDCTSASCAPAARRRARPTGGTASASSGRRFCCRRTAG